MTVTEEGGGRLNAFAKEPEIVVINEESSGNSSFKLLVATGLIFLITIFGLSLIIR